MTELTRSNSFNNEFKELKELKVNLQLDDLESILKEESKLKEKNIFTEQKFGFESVFTILEKFSGAKNFSRNKIVHNYSQILDYYKNNTQQEQKEDLDLHCIETNPVEFKSSDLSQKFTKLVKEYQKLSSTTDEELEDLSNKIHVGNFKVSNKSFTFQVNLDPRKPSVIPFSTLDQNPNHMFCANCGKKVPKELCHLENERAKDLELCEEHKIEFEKLVRNIVEKSNNQDFKGFLEIAEKSTTESQVLEKIYGDIYPIVNKLIFICQKLYEKTKDRKYFDKLVNLQYFKASVLYFKAFLNPWKWIGLLMLMIGYLLLSAVFFSPTIYIIGGIMIFFYMMGVFTKGKSWEKYVLLGLASILVIPIVCYGVYCAIRGLIDYFNSNSIIASGMAPISGPTFGLGYFVM